MKNSFFSEIRENHDSQIILGYFSFSLGVILLWVLTAIPSQLQNALVYITMLLAWGFLNHFDIVYDKLKMPDAIATNGISKNWMIALILGAITSLILILVVFKASIVQPLSIVSTNTIVSFLFVVVAAPIVEAQFFRGLIQPTLFVAIRKLFVKNDLIAWLIALAIQSATFAFFHINVFLGATDVTLLSYTPYFLFGIIATVGVYIIRDLSYEFGLHGINNLFAWIVK